MNLKKIKNKVLDLLKTSSIPLSEKEMIGMVLPVMGAASLERLYALLSNENKELSKLEKKKRRIEMKYQVMTENLARVTKSD